jgi:citrate synthase
MEPWRTAIVRTQDGEIRLRGYDITALMARRTFTDTVFLLHAGRLPEPRERELLDAILTAAADHGSGAPSCAAARLAASGNRQSLSAAIAAGVLAIGDEHGGAGSACMELIAASVERARAAGVTLDAAAREAVARAKAAGQRIPGLGHRLHSRDPRTPVLFDMARRSGVAGDGVVFLEAVEAAFRDAGKRLPINIDGALAAILHDLGFPPPVGKLVFIIGRVAGLSAEVLEEYTRERPMRVRVPVQYDGEPPRDLE